MTLLFDYRFLLLVMSFLSAACIKINQENKNNIEPKRNNNNEKKDIQNNNIKIITTL